MEWVERGVEYRGRIPAVYSLSGLPAVEGGGIEKYSKIVRKKRKEINREAFG